MCGSRSPRSLRRSHFRQLVLFFANRPDGKIFVAARFAAISRNGKTTPQESEARVYPIAGNTLQIQVAANGTVGVERIAETHAAGVKTRFADPAAPRKDTNDAEGIVRKILSTRPARIFTFADRASHSWTAGISWDCNSIGQSGAA